MSPWTHTTTSFAQEERACIMQMTHQGLSLRHIAAVLRRAPSSISREIRRNTIAVATVPYDAAAAGRQARQRLRQPRRPRKLQARRQSSSSSPTCCVKAGRHNEFKADCVNAILTIKLSCHTKPFTPLSTPRRAVSCVKT
ncbi:MAG: helix-turn-helix domain-containing protein [Rivihabitans pingtungensis]